MPLTLQNETKIIQQIIILSKDLTDGREAIRFYPHRVPLVIASYKLIRDNLKNYMTKNGNGDVVIDRHKVCAAITLSILKENIIEVIDPQKATFKDRSAKIYLTFLVSQSIMKDFYYQEHKKELLFLTPVQYLNEYQKLIYNNYSILWDIANNPHSDHSQVIFFLSHIFYLMELHSQEIAA